MHLLRTIGLTLAQLNPEGRTVLPPIAFRSFATNYVEPDLSEGFQDITRINFEVRKDASNLH